MELLTILAADYANIAEGGKLNVMGIFRNINGTIFPTRIPSMHLVIKLGADLGEYGETRELTIKLFDPDGKEIIKISGPIKIPEANNGQRPEVNAVLELRDLVFPNPGRYQFCVFIDKDHKGVLPIDVFQLDNPPQQIPV
ncbi:MAG: hypothetical protein C0401_03755 [Anaerolinea sp.]|nr:hypothetical protein [Anaerolinea sp.]